MSLLHRRFLGTTPGAALVTVVGAGGALSALVTDLVLWERLAGFGFFLGVGIAGAGMLLGRLLPERFDWCRRLGMALGLLVIGLALLCAGTYGAITGTDGTEPITVAIFSAVFGLVLTVLGVVALFATTRVGRTDHSGRGDGRTSHGAVEGPGRH